MVSFLEIVLGVVLAVAVVARWPERGPVRFLIGRLLIIIVGVAIFAWGLISFPYPGS